MIKLVQGDHGSNLYISCKNVDSPYAPIDLSTASSVKLRWKDISNVSQEVSMSILDSANGLVGVGLSSSILASAMTMSFDVKITFASGNILTNTVPIKAKVRAHA